MTIQKEGITISLSTDGNDFRRCAEIMAANDPWLKLGMDMGICLSAFEGNHREVYIADYEGELAGFVIIQVTGTFTGYIQSICISEKFRGIGIGTIIMKYCEKRILEFSPNIFICVSVFNQRAKKLYESMGYKPVGELESFLREGFTELLMRKTVGPRLGYTPAKNQ
jgi:[ribosomal protein S18]-alanine N-acetyltransferase